MNKRVLVTGATGYVGGRLVKPLTSFGFHVRCMPRKPSYLDGRTPPEVEIVHGDVSEPVTLDPVLKGIDIAFYLVHALASNGYFESTEVLGARNVMLA